MALCIITHKDSPLNTSGGNRFEFENQSCDFKICQPHQFFTHIMQKCGSSGDKRPPFCGVRMSVKLRHDRRADPKNRIMQMHSWDHVKLMGITKVWQLATHRQQASRVAFKQDGSFRLTTLSLSSTGAIVDLVFSRLCLLLCSLEFCGDASDSRSKLIWAKSSATVWKTSLHPWPVAAEVYNIFAPTLLAILVNWLSLTSFRLIAFGFSVPADQQFYGQYNLSNNWRETS